MTKATTALMVTGLANVGRLRVSAPGRSVYVDGLREARRAALDGLGVGETATVTMVTASRPWSRGLAVRTFYYVPGKE